MVDSDSSEEYDTKLAKFISSVEKLGDKENEFCNYFLSYKSRLIKETMRSDIRTTVGLGLNQVDIIRIPMNRSMYYYNEKSKVKT